MTYFYLSVFHNRIIFSFILLYVKSYKKSIHEIFLCIIIVDFSKKSPQELLNIYLQTSKAIHISNSFFWEIDFYQYIISISLPLCILVGAVICKMLREILKISYAYHYRFFKKKKKNHRRKFWICIYKVLKQCIFDFYCIKDLFLLI